MRSTENLPVEPAASVLRHAKASGPAKRKTVRVVRTQLVDTVQVPPRQQFHHDEEKTQWVEARPAPTKRKVQRTARTRIVAAPENAYASAPADAVPTGRSTSVLVNEARRYIGGGNPTKRRTLWCGAFMNLVLERTGHKPINSDKARSFASYGRRVAGPQVGALAILTRGKDGGHVGVVSGVDPKGNPIIVSGNHNNRVAEAVYPRGRIIAYVMPGGV